MICLPVQRVNDCCCHYDDESLMIMILMMLIVGVLLRLTSVNVQCWRQSQKKMSMSNVSVNRKTKWWTKQKNKTTINTRLYKSVKVRWQPKLMHKNPSCQHAQCSSSIKQRLSPLRTNHFQRITIHLKPGMVITAIQSYGVPVITDFSWELLPLPEVPRGF